MDELIIRVLCGTASAFEEERLKRWRAESPENEQFFRETERVWALTAPEKAEAEIPPPPVEQILLAARRRSEDDAPDTFPAISREAKGPVSQPDRTDRSRRDVRRFRDRRLWWGLALAAGVVALALGLQLGGVAPWSPEPWATYAAASGETRTITLDDGSFVRLASGSRLEDWSTESERRVALSGKGFFAVTHDAERPFVVDMDAGSIRVLGTRFELTEDHRELRAVVVEGRVRVSNDQGSVEATLGEVATIARGSAPVTEEAPDVYALLDWPAGVLIFQGTPLEQVTREVSRHFGRELQVHEPELRTRRISASFEEESFQEVAESLCLVAGAECIASTSGMIMGLTEGRGEAR